MNTQPKPNNRLREREMSQMRERKNALISLLEEDAIHDRIDFIYEAMEGIEDLMQYHSRHGTPSLQVLTQHSPEIAFKTAEKLADWIRGKEVIEIGAGVGFLALELARYAKSVIAIESDPAWSWVFTRSLYRHKPKNLTWIFGDANEMAGKVTGEICLVFTCSGVDDLRVLGGKFSQCVFLPFQDAPNFFE